TRGVAPRSPVEASGIERAAETLYPLIQMTASPTRTADGIGFVVMPPHDQMMLPVARSWLRIRVVPLVMTCDLPPYSTTSGVFQLVFSSCFATHRVFPVAASRQ